MVSALLAAIVERLNERKNRLLLVAQAALPDSQFQAFRKLTLDEFGRSGLEKELEELLQRLQGQVTNGQADICRKGGAAMSGRGCPYRDPF